MLLPVTPIAETKVDSKADAVAAGAVDAARASLVEDVGAADVGEHLGSVAEGERVVPTSSAAPARCTSAGTGPVTVVRASRRRKR